MNQQDSWALIQLAVCINCVFTETGMLHHDYIFIYKLVLTIFGSIWEGRKWCSLTKSQ